MDQTRQPVAGNSSALLNSNNLLPQGGPMEQNNSRLMRTEGWVIHQHGFDRPVQDTAHAYPPVSQHNAQLMQGQEKKPTMQPLPTIQESPHSGPHQQPPTSNHLLPSSGQVGPRFEGYVNQPATAVHIGQGNKQFITQPPFSSQVGPEVPGQVMRSQIPGQESPHSGSHQQPPTSNYLPPVSGQVSPRFEGYVDQPAAAVHVSQGTKQFITQPTFSNQVGTEVLVRLSEAQDIERSIIEIALPTISFRR